MHNSETWHMSTFQCSFQHILGKFYPVKFCQVTISKSFEHNICKQLHVIYFLHTTYFKLVHALKYALPLLFVQTGYY